MGQTPVDVLLTQHNGDIEARSQGMWVGDRVVISALHSNLEDFDGYKDVSNPGGVEEVTS